MSWLQFSASVINAIFSWPVAIVVAVIILRHSLGRVIAGLERLGVKAAGGELTAQFAHDKAVVERVAIVAETQRETHGSAMLAPKGEQEQPQESGEARGEEQVQVAPSDEQTDGEMRAARKAVEERRRILDSYIEQWALAEPRMVIRISWGHVEDAIQRAATRLFPGVQNPPYPIARSILADKAGFSNLVLTSLDALWRVGEAVSRDETIDVDINTGFALQYRLAAEWMAAQLDQVGQGKAH